MTPSSIRFLICSVPARLDFQPILGPPRDIKTVGAVRHHPLELLDLKSSKQIKASLDNVISESKVSLKNPLNTYGSN